MTPSSDRLDLAGSPQPAVLRISRIHHLGLLVADLNTALALYGQSLGAAAGARWASQEDGVEVALVDLGASLLELMQPLRADSGVGRFLARRGPGMHHVAYLVEDIEAELSAARGAGLDLIDQRPRPGLNGTTIAFLHPRTMGGVLTELVQERR